MIITEIYFIRHGETDANLEKKFAGRFDAALTEKGIKQAELCKRFLQGRNFDCVFSSPLLRARETAEILFGGNFVSDERLLELDGGKWNGLPYKFIKENYGEAFAVYKNDIDNFQAINGESVTDVCNRLNNFIDYVLKNYSGKKVCVVSHAICIRTIFAFFMHKRVQEIDFPTNASYSVLRFGDDRICDIEYSVDNYIGILGTNIKI